jgi:UDP-3-O-[3-hydroxymyristoyl] glucosamine N-acyltransferase
MPSVGSPQPIGLTKIAEAVSGQVHGAGETIVCGVSSLADAEPHDLTYVASERFVNEAAGSRAGAFVVGRLIPVLKRPQIIVENPSYAFACIAERFFTMPVRPRGMSPELVCGENITFGPDASVWPFVTLGDRVKIGARVTIYPGVFVGDDATLGDDVVLYPNVIVRERCVIGNRVVIHSGTVIGSDGFGYVQHEGRHQKVPQLGVVVLEDDVELGANVTVDRATFGRTLIKRGTKVDNLVQIAHNVCIGEHSIIVAQVGIAGSTMLGHHVMVGGQAGLSDHLQVGDRVMIAARAGVNRHLMPDQTVSGAPAMPHDISVKAQAIIPLLPELRRQVRDLEQRVRNLEGQIKKAKGRVRK